MLDPYLLMNFCMYPLYIITFIILPPVTPTPSGLSGGAVAAIVIVLLLVVVLAVAVVIVVLWLRKRSGEFCSEL